MARTILQRPDPDTITLSRLINHLESNLAANEAQRRSPYLHQKVNANFEYARMLLLRLEHDSTSIKALQQRQAVQADLAQKRERIKVLQIRLQERNQAPYKDDDEESESSTDTESSDGPIPQYGPAVTETNNTINTEPSEVHEAAERLTATLRSRTKKDRNMTSEAAATASGNAFSQRSENSNMPSYAANGSSADRENVLSAHRSEQEDLTQSLLSLATQLKSSAQGFSSSLEHEKEILDRTSLGLDKNISGMDAAGRRMTTLRRMTEGKGWWGRMMLYAWIAGLWIALFLVMFLMPKLRF